MTSVVEPVQVDKTRHIIQDMRLRLRAGQWGERGRLPTEARLASHYGVCRPTLKKALTALQRQGLIISRQGKGHFVAPTPERTRTWSIGFMVRANGHFDHPVTMQRFAGLQEALLGSPYHLKPLVQYDAYPIPSAPGEVPPAPAVGLPCDINQLDALITHRLGMSDDSIREAAREIPICCTDWFEEGWRLSRVHHDMLAANTALFGHLVELGHRRLAHTINLQDADRNCNNAELRQAVRLTKLARCDHGFSCEEFPIAGNTPEAGRELAARLLALPAERRPTALNASSDILIGVYQVFAERGLSIPADLSVAAIDSLSPASRALDLTGVYLDYRRLGEATGRELLRLLADPAALGQEIVLPVEWHGGRSARPPMT